MSERDAARNMLGNRPGAVPAGLLGGGPCEESSTALWGLKTARSASSLIAGCYSHHYERYRLQSDPLFAVIAGSGLAIAVRRFRK